MNNGSWLFLFWRCRHSGWVIGYTGGYLAEIFPVFCFLPYSLLISKLENYRNNYMRFLTKIFFIKIILER